jgi:hypothetical protein
MWRRLAWKVFTGVSHEYAASILMIEEFSFLEDEDILFLRRFNKYLPG